MSTYLCVNMQGDLEIWDSQWFYKEDWVVITGDRGIQSIIGHSYNTLPEFWGREILEEFE